MNTQEAIRLLGTYTAGRFDIWMLSGSAKASCRAHVLSVLLGVKTPQSKSGVNALREAFYQAGNIEGDCLAAREENFLLWVRKETEDVSKSWKAGVKTPGDHDWVYNSLRFKTKEDAEAYVSDLATRWTAVQETVVTESDEEPNR
jgi:hypothetical protein